jgi:hypothetical protein
MLATLAALATFTPALRADWGSLRANNRPERGRAAERGRPEPERGRVAVERGHSEAPRAAEERHMDIEAERRRGLYWAGYPPGLAIWTLPPGYVQVAVGPTGYYYYNGVFFRCMSFLLRERGRLPSGFILPRFSPHEMSELGANCPVEFRWRNGGGWVSDDDGAGVGEVGEMSPTAHGQRGRGLDGIGLADGGVTKGPTEPGHR